jgi:hypothetical protein
LHSTKKGAAAAAAATFICNTFHENPRPQEKEKCQVHYQKPKGITHGQHVGWCTGKETFDDRQSLHSPTYNNNTSNHGTAETKDLYCYTLHSRPGEEQGHPSSQNSTCRITTEKGQMFALSIVIIIIIITIIPLGVITTTTNFFQHVNEQ